MIHPRPDLIFLPSPENPLTLIVAYANERAQIDLMEMGLFKSWPPRFRLNSAITEGGHPVSLQRLFCRRLTSVSVAMQPVRTETLSSVWGALSSPIAEKHEKLADGAALFISS